MTWIYTLTAVFIVSLVSFIGILTIALKMEVLKKIVMFLVSLSAGALLGGAFFHLIPEAAEEFGFTLRLGVFILSGILVFFALEKIICWRHCHIPTSKDHPHPVAIMNLIGDAFHNLIDGAIIAASFLVSFPLGVSTTVAVLLHEIPQEIGDFGVLVHGGFGRFKALLLNFASALTSVLGAVLVLSLNVKVETIAWFLVPFTAGGFIYIAGSDLIPEMKKDIVPLNSLIQMFFLLLGLAIMLALVVFG
ncbi:MAG: ZIP family metal transporter [Candidatus Margulisbacteria bacterium]|nr:ZIP family metal transporter [Candidatus Margulisiibacteriota bacterium]